jgi:hypothetical protein
MKALILAVSLAVMSVPAFAATAFWTGQSHPVQTVTFQQGWECQYQYAGQYFWVVETGFCPSSIEVN